MSLILDLSDQLYREISDTTNTSIASISFWLRGIGNIGQLNNLLFTTYSLKPALEIIDNGGNYIGEAESAIYKKLYELFYYNQRMIANLGAAGTDVIQVSSDGGTARIIQKTDIAKVFLQMKTETKDTLKTLVNTYRLSKNTPSSINSADFAFPRNNGEFPFNNWGRGPHMPTYW